MKKLPQLSLTGKGLIIVVLPLIFQVSFFAFYQKLLNDTDQIVSTEEHAKNIIGRLNWISALVMAADLSATGYRLTGDNRLLDTMAYVEPRLNRELKDTSELLDSGSEQADLMGDIHTQVDSLMKVLKGGIAEKQAAGGATNLDKGDEQNIQSISRLFSLRHDLLKLETANHSFSMAYTPQMRHIKRDFIAFGILLDAAVAMIIFAVFSRTITSRLAVLTNNLNRFSSGQELNPPVGGNDEVAVLDENFHEMAGALRVAQQRKKEYLQMLSHDLRTPIANVLLALELIEKTEPETHARSKTHLESAERNLERALGLINQILEIETIEAGAISLNYDAMTSTELCNKAVEAVQYLAFKRNIKIETFDQALDFVADLDRLLQVMINLLGNAVKFSPDDSKIVITTESIKNRVKISIRDHGRGIPTEALNKVFERFQQVKVEDQKTGSGLGLAVCRAIIDAHGGKIGVESTLGVGSTFWFEIPDEPASTSV